MYRNGRTDEAIASIKEAVRLAPDNATFHYDLGIVLYEKKLPGEAIANWRDAVRLQPDHRDAHYNLGLALAEQGEIDDAIVHYEEAIRLAPNKYEAYTNLALLLATSSVDRVRNGPRAIQLATKAFELTEYKESTFIGALAAAYAESGNFELAVKWGETAVKLSEPENRNDYIQHLESFRQGKPWREK